MVDEFKERSRKARAMRKGGAARRDLEGEYEFVIITNSKFSRMKQALGKEGAARLDNILMQASGPRSNKIITIAILRNGKVIGGVETVGLGKGYEVVSIPRVAVERKERKAFFERFGQKIGDELVAQALKFTKRKEFMWVTGTMTGRVFEARLIREGKIREDGIVYRATDRLKTTLKKHRHRMP